MGLTDGEPFDQDWELANVWIAVRLTRTSTEPGVTALGRPAVVGQAWGTRDYATAEGTLGHGASP
jgi:hypothetical protein